MDLGLKDRVALVAASSQGLGKAVALGLAREGARLALCARTESTLQATAEEIRRETGVEVMSGALDVTDYDQVRDFVAETVEHFGRLDICVANAGGPPTKTFAETTMEDWHRGGQSEPDEHGAPGQGDPAGDAAAPLGALHRHHLDDREAAGGRTDPLQLRALAR